MRILIIMCVLALSSCALDTEEQVRQAKKCENAGYGWELNIGKNSGIVQGVQCINTNKNKREINGKNTKW